MKRVMLIGLLLGLVALAPLSASIIVTANMNIFGAGHPAPPFNGGTEGVLPILALSGLTSGQAVTFPSVTGTTSCGTNPAFPCFSLIGPDGAALVAGPGTDINALAGTNVGISGLTFVGRQMFLTGLFIGGTEPTGTGPAGLTY